MEQDVTEVRHQMDNGEMKYEKINKRDKRERH